MSTIESPTVKPMKATVIIDFPGGRCVATMSCEDGVTRSVDVPDGLRSDSADVLAEKATRAFKTQPTTLSWAV